MKKILHIISSPRGAASLSTKLGNAIVEKLQTTYQGSTVKEIDLAKHPLPHLEEAHITSLFTPEDQRSPENKAALQHSDEAVSEVKGADVIVIDAPLYNFSIPATLKGWLDHITRPGVTFRYTENGPVGLVNGKKVYLAISSGGVYSAGPMQSYDFVDPYLRALLGFLGMSDVSTFRIEGTAIPGMLDTAIANGIASVQVD